jgi:hypothetical protein
MKKSGIIFVLLILSIAINGFSQTTAPTDFFAGKWEINVPGTPAGDVKFVIDLVRKDGKLTGALAILSKPERIINKIDEKADEIVIFFTSSQGDGVPLALAKVDNDNLEGTLKDSFEATAKRLKD